jgi:ribosome-binding factor A
MLEASGVPTGSTAMPLPFRRADRVGDLVRRELSRLLLREIKDPRLGQVVVTKVEMSADLRHARVFFTGAPGPDHAGEVAGLQSAAGFLRGKLGRSLRLRNAPELAFEVDDSVDRSLHIAALLKQVAREGSDE